jgi:hypothetical protein
MFSGVTVVTTLVCYLHTAHEAADAPSVRHSLRPLLPEGQCSCIAPGASRRENADLYLIPIFEIELCKRGTALS